MWTLNQGDGTISRVDTKTSKLVATIRRRYSGNRRRNCVRGGFCLGDGIPNPDLEN